MKRIYHHYETWECLRMYLPYDGEVVDHDTLLHLYADFLRDIHRFKRALNRVKQEWPLSCEQFLSNESINRIAWLGQAAMCIDTGVPRKYRAGFMLLSAQEQEAANRTAQECLAEWLEDHARKNSTIQQGMESMWLF